MLPRLLARLALASARRPALVLLAALLLGAGAAALAATRLGVTTDTGILFAPSLPWKQRERALQQAFPQNSDLLVVVVDGTVPEAADATANALARTLAADARHFRSVRRPDRDPYLARNALLFLDQQRLQALLDQTIDAQPFLGQLASDPSLRGLLGALDLIAEGVERGQADLGPFAPALRGFGRALAAAADGKPVPLSWQRLLAGPVADLAGQYRFVLTQPRLDYGALEPGAEAADAVRRAAAALEWVRDGTARVRMTGSVALENEEFATVARGAAWGLSGSLLVIVLLLFMAVRSWRLVAPILLTLVLGLVLTTGFAALSVGTLNLVSVAFAVLFIGIAVDFAIQFAVRFRAVAGTEAGSLADAVATTGRRAGTQILVAAAATAAGFLAFTPTSFRGVAQLGLIAGGGMLIAFACTLVVLPALLAITVRIGALAASAEEGGLRWLARLDASVARSRRALLLLGGALAVAGLASLPWVKFDGDPLNTKNPGTEAMWTLRDLEDDPLTNPYSAEILAPSLDDAARIAASLRRLPLADEVLTLHSLVPEDQEAKLPLIADAANLLAPTLAATPSGPRPGAAELRAAMRETSARLSDAAARRTGSAADAPALLAPIADALRRLCDAPDALVLATDAALTRYLPAQLDLLREALSPTTPVTWRDVPQELARDWLLPDGRAKVQATPKAEVRGSDGLRRFLEQVRSVTPDAGGSADQITGSADTITGAFRSAAGLALVAITAILLVTLRRVLDASLVLAALLLSALLTVLACALLPLPLNFANIIALPLLLGVGVSFNIYFVMNWRLGYARPLGSATARAVLFSALTTADAFGSLALSAHPGTASMGKLLLVSLTATLLTTLVFVPALLASLPRRPTPSSSAP